MRPLHEIIICGVLDQYNSGALSTDDVFTIACSLIGHQTWHLDEQTRHDLLRHLERQMNATIALYWQQAAGHA